MRKNYNMSYSKNGIVKNFAWQCENDADAIALMRVVINASIAGKLITPIDFNTISARRQWEDGIHETIINVFYEMSDIYFFTAVYNCVTFNFDYVSDTLPA